MVKKGWDDQIASSVHGVEADQSELVEVLEPGLDVPFANLRMVGKDHGAQVPGVSDLTPFVVRLRDEPKPQAELSIREPPDLSVLQTLGLEAPDARHLQSRLAMRLVE
jgi:hypothetical protein